MSRIVMVALAASIPQAATAQTAPACAPGVYAIGSGGGLTPLALTRADHRKVTGVVGFMLLGPLGGNKMKVKTVLNGPEAATRLSGARPSFRFCFAAPAAPRGDGSDYVGVSAAAGSISEYQLVRLEQAKAQRELALSSAGGFGGPKGQLHKSSVPFTVQPAGEGQFVITPSRDLPAGEYGFLSTVPAPGSVNKKDVSEQVYDFAVLD